MATTRMISVDELEVGMYVASLDRPWLETPFLFQGFYINDGEEIEALRTFCQHVFVSQSVEPAVIPGPVKATKPVRVQPQSASQQMDLARRQVVHDESVSLAKELRTATGVRERVMSTVQDVMKNLESSGNLDVERLEQSVSPMVDSVVRNPAALSCLMRLQKKDAYLYHHSLASSVWATILGRQLGLDKSDLAVVALGGMLLDVGKVRVPDEIIGKTGELDERERHLVRQHVAYSLEIVGETGDIDMRVLDMIAHHHERHNGSGYPQGLVGNEIPVFGRIAGIADTYDAMITRRPYAQPLSSYEALRQLQALADQEFQADIIEQFTRAIGVFPTGTLVELNTGEVAIVTKQNRTRRLLPEVMVIMGNDKQLLEQFVSCDLNEQQMSSQGHRAVWIERGLPPGAYGIEPTEFFLD